MSEKIQDLSHLKVLIVDDVANMRTVIKTALQTMGIRNVSTANDGADALKELHLTSDYDIVLLDINMSPLDGLDTLRLLRTGKDSPAPKARVIMVTGYTDAATVMAAKEIGIQGYIAKPISIRALYSSIVKALKMDV